MAEKKMITRNFGPHMTRLMDVLDYKCRQGVKVYILIYYEVSLVMSLNSKYTEGRNFIENKKFLNFKSE